MKTLCIYHANCADGFGAAWVVRKALGADNVDFHPGKYGEPAPDVEGRDVIIVDFSYKRDQLLQLAQVARSILIIDHHKSAAEDLADIPSAPKSYWPWVDAQQPLSAVFDMERSGAGLAWDFFYPGKARPALIDHIEDRDLWRWALDGTAAVTASLFSHHQDFETWGLLMVKSIRSHRADGESILRKQAKDIADLVPNARRLTIGGHDVPALNCPHFMASDAGHILGQGEPFAACYSDTPKGRVFSLRSTDAGVDVSEIAKQYGGGGHRNAAGFTVPFDHELVTGFLPATLESTEPSDDIVLTPAAQDILAQCIAAHAFVVAAITNGRPDAALAEARKWVESFQQAAQQLKDNIEPMSFERDECGHWTHPAWPKDGDEDTIPKGWFADRGLEVCVIEFEHDATEEQTEAYFEQGDPDCSTWQPSMPVGEGWFVFSIHDTEDGPICVWVRPATEDQP